MSGRPARVMMLSWEYPPVLVGGLGRHVHALATTLSAAGHEVTVVTRHAPGAPLQENSEGVRIIRAAEDAPTFPLDPANPVTWSMAFNHALARAALKATRSGGFDVVHAHDWLVTYAAVTLRDHLDVPLVATIHATEAGRHQGWLPQEHNRTVHSIERWLVAEAVRVIVCSDFMRRDVTALLDAPADRTDVVPNGVDLLRWHARPPAVTAARCRFAHPREGAPLVTYAGRLVYEKGVQHLITALPDLRQRHPDLRLVVAGDGPHRSELQAQATAAGLDEAITFTGFLRGHDLTALMAASDCFVVPSIYEPFGMVALEAAAVGTPVAVADAGGLGEIVEHRVTGMTFAAEDPGALAAAVGAVLADRELARGLARRARRQVREEFNWASIATRTAAVYDLARSNNTARAAGTAEPIPGTGPDGSEPTQPSFSSMKHHRHDSFGSYERITG